MQNVGGEEGQTECTIGDPKIEDGQFIGLLNVFTVALFSKISHLRAVTKAMLTLSVILTQFLQWSESAPCPSLKQRYIG